MATLAGRPTSSYRLPAPAPAGPQRWRREEEWHERPGVAQFIYLSLLLHAIAILLFGAPAGGSREGRAMWGSLDVVLRAPAPDLVLPPAMEPLAAPRPLPKLERELRIPPPAAPKPAQQRTAPLIEPIIVPPRMERIAPPPLKLDKALPTPKIEVIPLPADAPPIVVPAPAQPIVPDLPRVERVMVEPPKLTAPLAQPVAPPAKERAPSAPAEVPRIETQALPTLPAAPALPAIERTPVIAEPPKAAAPPAPPQPEPAPRMEEKRVAPAPREELPVPPASPFRPPVPVPSPADARPGVPGYDPTKPAVDLDAVRNRASQMAREGAGQRALLPFPMPAPPERKTKTEEALEKARKPDCRTAYKDLGLLAAVPLIANEFGEGTCRW